MVARILFVHGAAGHRQHETGINSLGTDVDTMSCATARAGPFFRCVRRFPTLEGLNYARCDLFIRYVTDVDNVRRRANRRAFPAHRAIIDDALSAGIKRRYKSVSTSIHVVMLCVSGLFQQFIDCYRDTYRAITMVSSDATRDDDQPHKDANRQSVLRPEPGQPESMPFA